MQSSLSPKKRIRAGKYDIDVRTSSSARLSKHMILIHGIGVSGRYFVPYAEECAKKYNVHIIDMPGYGTTPKPNRPLNLERMADVVAEYMRSCSIENAVIVGQSMGCQTAVRFAVRHSNLCTQLVLIAPTVNRMERNIFVQAIRLVQDTFFESLQANKIILIDYLRMGFGRYLKTTRFMLDDRIEDNLQKVTAKTLIIRGAKDPIVPTAWTNYLAGQADHFTATEIPNAAHVVQFTNPKELFNVTNAFINI